MSVKIRFVIAAVALALCALVAPAAVSVSFAAAFAAVVAPYFLAAYAVAIRARRADHGAPFYFWAVKFSLTILLLAVTLRGLSEMALLAPAFYMAGVAAGVLCTGALALRFPPIALQSPQAARAAKAGAQKSEAR